MTPEFYAMQEIGRKILRNYGVDPDTAFSGGPDDPRLALVPAALEKLNILNKHFLDIGYTIKDVQPRDPDAHHTPTGEDTPGPWGDLDLDWEEEEHVHSISELTSKELEACWRHSLKELTLTVGPIAAGAKTFEMWGKALLTLVEIESVLTVGVGIGIAGSFYLGYKMMECTQDKINDREKCHITVDLDEWCRRKRAAGEDDRSCDPRHLISSKLSALELRLGTDTLRLVVDPNFIANQ
jgi:hypothetical protein